MAPVPENEAGHVTGMWDAIFHWASGQTFNNVLLASILGAIVYGSWWAMTVGVPSHLTQIQHGYETVTKDHAMTVEKISTEHTRQVETISREFRSEVQHTEDLMRELMGKPKAAPVPTKAATAGTQ